MAAKNKPYEQFGQYILLKKLESDAFSELWRAATIESTNLGPVVALRRFTAGNHDALAAAATSASRILPLLTGTSFVKQQVAGVIEDVPFIAYEYAGGRSLRQIVEKSRGAAGSQPHPMPLDQAIVIAEKVALSLATTADLRFEGSRLGHGCLLPQFVWITDDGEIRVAGQQLAAGVLASLRDSRAAAELSRYFAPESVASGIASKTADVYAMGGLLFLLVTGIEPPDGINVSAFSQVVRGARTATGEAIPVDIRAILDRSLTLDANARFATMAEMKQAITGLANSGKYSATTFNLAFYVSTLLKKELEAEALDRDRESKVNVAPYVEAMASPAAAPRVASAPPVETPMFAAAVEASKARSKAPLAAAAIVVVVAAGGGAFFMFRSQASAAKAAPATVQTAASVVTPTRPAIVSQPLVAAAPVTTATATAAPTDTAADEAARKQAFEAAVQQKLQEEMMKLQADYTRKLQQTQSKQAPVPVATASAAPAPPPLRPAEEPSAAQLDQQQRASRSEPVAPPVQQTQSAAAAPVAAPAAVQPPPPPAVREGDIIDIASVDTAPHVTRAAAPIYPPMAIRQHVSATVIVTALVSETGEVTDVKILRGDERFGFNESAARAVRATRFAPATKDGKRVKVWYPIPVQFKQ